MHQQIFVKHAWCSTDSFTLHQCSVWIVRFPLTPSRSVSGMIEKSAANGMTDYFRSLCELCDLLLLFSCGDHFILFGDLCLYCGLIILFGDLYLCCDLCVLLMFVLWTLHFIW